MKYLLTSLLLITSLIIFSCTEDGETTANTSKTQPVPEVTTPQSTGSKTNEQSAPLRYISKLKRKVAYEVTPESTNETGKVNLNICIDPKGDIVYAKLNQKESTLTNQTTIEEALNAMNKTTFQPSNSTSAKECGMWTFTYNGHEKVHSAIHVVKKQN